MPFAMVDDEAPNPVDVSLLGANTVVFTADDVPDLVEQFWFARGQHSQYSLRHDTDFVLPSPKFKPD